MGGGVRWLGDWFERWGVEEVRMRVKVKMGGGWE